MSSSPPSPTAASPLPTRALAGYGLAAIPAQFMYVLVLIMYLKFAVDDLGASASAVGTIFFLARMWDAVSDPMVGSWSDRTRHRMGRRKIWLLAAGPMLALSAIALWMPPAGLEGAALSAWIAVAVIAFYTAYTCFEVPHMALGAEMSADSTERNKIFGVRQITRTVGMLAAGVGGTALVQRGTESAAAMALTVGGLTVVLVTLGVRWMPKERPEFMGRGGENAFRAIRDVLSNPHARLVLFVYFIESIGSGGIGVLTPFVIEYVLLMPEIVPPMLGLYMLSALIAVPIWITLGRRFEKRHLWLFAMVQGGIGYGILFWLDEGTWLLMVVSSLMAGTAGACGNTLGQAIKAEIIDFDEYRTGERKEGAYFAGWSFAGKLAGGIMVAVVGFALDLSGYVENAAEQAESAKRTMIFLTGGIPMIGYAIGSVLFTRFSLTEAEHARIRFELDARNAADGAGDGA